MDKHRPPSLDLVDQVADYTPWPVDSTKKGAVPNDGATFAVCRTGDTKTNPEVPTKSGPTREESSVHPSVELSAHANTG